MQLFENIVLAVNGLLSNKMRALLTMLGIIIGISSVITIVTIGGAMTSSVTSMFDELGASNVTVQISDKPDENGNYNYTRPYAEEDMMTDEMIDTFREAFGEKVAVVAVTSNVGDATAMNGHNQAKGFVTGTNAGAIDIQNIPIIAGHFLNEKEVKSAKNVAVISDKFVEKLFPGISMQEALGREVKLEMAVGTEEFMVVGVYKFELTGMMAGMAGDTSTSIFVPITVADRLTNPKLPGYYFMTVKAGEGITDSKAFAKQTEDFFNRTFYRSNDYVEVRASTMESMITQMTGMLDTMSLAISVIAAISLLVGGIGVMNIMLVSVTERTREIGTRKALGAKNHAIRVQFIVESMIICLIGGAIGVILGTTFGRVGSTLLGAPSWPSISIVLIAVGFSMAIGVFFGYYPANKAAKLDPIEALRYE